MSEPVRIEVHFICKRCRGRGILHGGTMMETGCPDCKGEGARHELMEMDEAALQALAKALLALGSMA